MSDTIQGAKSRSYVKNDPIPNIENCQDSLEYSTVQEMPGRRGGLDVVIHGQHTIPGVHAVEAGSVRRLIKSTAHGAQKGWVMRPSTGAAKGEEITIVKIVDADTFVISDVFNLAIGDSFDICTFVTPSYTETGELLVVANQGPVQFVLNNVDTEVELDTVVPANTKPLPTELIFNKDGAPTRVSYNTITPTSSDAIPVNIVTVNGVGIETTVNLSGAQINVQLSDRGASPDATRIGDGTNLMGVNASLEALVHDQGSIDLLTTIDADTSLLANTITTEGGAQPSHALVVGGHTGGGLVRHLRVDTNGRLQIDINSSALPAGAATAANQATQEAILDAILTELDKKADLTETQPVSIAGTVTVSGGITDAELRATPVPVSGAVTANLGTLNGAATEAKQDAQSVLLGAVSETAPVSDTANSGLNGRLQRVAQNISALILQLPATLGIKTAANSLSIAPASDAVFGVKDRPLTNSFVQLSSVTTIQTITAPANAIGGKIQALSDNAGNVRYVPNGIAGLTFGIRLEPGRSEDFSGGSDITVISESGTNEINISWTIQA